MGTYVPPLTPQGFVNKQGPVVGASWLNAIDAIFQGQVPAAGVYNATFVSGEVQVTGPQGYLTSYGDFGFSLLSPGPGGTGPFLRVAGATKNFGQIGTDAQVPNQHGIDLFVAAGDTAVTGSAVRGGNLWLFGGASQSSQGGLLNLQAGSSVNGVGGDVTIFGGNNTANNAAAGNIYMVAGTTGNAGGNIKIYATKLGSVAGDISFWLGQPDIPHSVPLWTMSHTGALFPASSGAGTAADVVNAIAPSVLVTGGNLASPLWTQLGVAGSITLTLSGATSSTPASFFGYTSDGLSATLVCLQTLVAGTTGPDDIILSTLPIGIRPAGTRLVPCVGLQNGGAVGYFGQASINPAGGVTISLAIPTNAGTSLGILPNNWSLAANKGVVLGWTITYPL
jgi:hypothetical protein